MAVTYNSAWAGLSLHTSSFDTSPYSRLEFAILPAGSTLPQLAVSLSDSADEPIRYVGISSYATSAGGGWFRVSIPLADLGGVSRTVTRVTIGEDAGSAQPTFYVDELEFSSGTTPPPPPPPPGNQAPTVDAEPETQTITLPATASLSGTVSDDGLPNPPANVTTTWSKVSGPGTVTFSPGATAEDPTASFSVAGTYVLRLSGSDSLLSAFDDLTVTVNAGPQPPPGAEHVVYGDSLLWDDWSWSTTVNTGATPSPVFAGTNSMAVTYNSAWAGLSLHTSSFDTSPFSHLEFAILPAGSTLPNVDVSLYGTTGGPIKSVKLSAYASAVGNGWYTVSIPLADLGGSNTTITRVQLQEGSGTAGVKPTFHVDELKFVDGGTATG
jgi:hypothetical protein